MSNFPSKSPLQFQHLPGGQVQLAGRADVLLLVHQEQATAKFPEWERTLELPIYQQHWEEWAVPRGMSRRQLRFVLCDESPTKQVGSWRIQPGRIRFAEPLSQGGFLLTLGHSGFCIGVVYALTLATKETIPLLGLDVPDWVEGDCLIGQAVLYESKLADAAWRGTQQGILNRVCAVVFMEPNEPPGTGALVEVALVSEAEAACPGARILKTWECA